MAAEVSNSVEQISIELAYIDEPTFNQFIANLESFKQYLLENKIVPIDKTGAQVLSKIDFKKDFKDKISLLATEIDKYFKANTEERSQYGRTIQGSVEMAFLLLYFPFIENKHLNLYVSFINF